MEIEQKRIFFGISPHINYYHSYRGDSVGPAGFGHDLRTMAKILSQLEAIEAKGLSIKSWFKGIRRKQQMGEIRGHALVFFNFDMDSEGWTGRSVSRLLRWLPNTRGLWELAEAVDALDYVEFANLIDVIPKLVSSGHVYSKTTLRQDVDCLSSAISDGWMALSTGEHGLLVGFNALEAANFAYAPLKLRDRGFGDASREGQQVRLNPFGTYFGHMLHYWHDGTGHAQEIAPATASTCRSTGPSFNGKTIAFELVYPEAMVNSRADKDYWTEALDMIAGKEGKTLDLECLITKRISLEEAVDAFHYYDREKWIKVIVEPHRG